LILHVIPSSQGLALRRAEGQNISKDIRFKERAMKRLSFWIGLAAFLGLGTAWSQALTEDQHWVEQVGGSFGIPASSSAAQALNLGFGGDLSIGYRLDTNFSLGIGTGYHQFDFKNPPPGVSGKFSYVPLQLGVRYTFGSGGLRAYLLLSAGAAINTLGTTHSTTETDFLFSPGLGALLVVDTKAAIYLQTKFDMDFTRSTFSNDNPTLFVPIDAGLIFYLL
jgi:hypothetical protein